ncbi:hypothetical protein DENSPDRAFT_839679 [Dentipellis sp. KUC8613]|nr:hypothetical protein DENSPDRAFT_839679 [Dentipellis sp. KUC8613]
MHDARSQAPSTEHPNQHSTQGTEATCTRPRKCNTARNTKTPSTGTESTTRKPAHDTKNAKRCTHPAPPDKCRTPPGVLPVAAQDSEHEARVSEHPSPGASLC